MGKSGARSLAFESLYSVESFVSPRVSRNALIRKEKKVEIFLDNRLATCENCRVIQLAQRLAAVIRCAAFESRVPNANAIKGDPVDEYEWERLEAAFNVCYLDLESIT